MITQEEITALANDYVKDVYGGDTDFIDEAENIISWLLQKNHIVSKEEIKDFHQFASRNYKLDCENGNEDGQASFWRGQMELLKTIFGKEALDSDAGE